MSGSDEFQFWRDALVGAAVQITADQPQSGYYKMRPSRDADFLPVAIWRKGSDLVCRVGNTMRDPADVWLSCAKHPVAKDAAKQAFETGAWPGDIPVPGHNSGSLSIDEEINDTATSALEWLNKSGVTDKASSDMAANWRAKLLDLSKRADKEREIEKAPHLAASRAVDAKFKPWVETATDAANRLRDALTIWMRSEEAKARAEAEAKRKAEEARIAAERKRLEDERAKLIKNDPIAALTSPEPKLPELPLAVEPVKVQAGGQRGRKTGLRTVTRYEVADYEAALAAVKDHPEVRAAVEKVAAARAKTGVDVPGIKRIEERVAA